jgi:hypothetical protein
MLVRVKLNLGLKDYPGHAHRAGETVDMPDSLAAKAIRRGHVEPIVVAPLADPPATRLRETRRVETKPTAADSETGVEAKTELPRDGGEGAVSASLPPQTVGVSRRRSDK